MFVHGCGCCTNSDDAIPPPPGCSAGCVIMNYANRRKLRVGDFVIVKSYEPKIVLEDYNIYETDPE